MSRYIDANLINFEFVTDTVCQDQAYEAVEAVPTADVRENIHAHWEDWSFLGFDMGTHWFRRCSNCLCEREDDNEEKDTPFCPNCGAVMDEKGEEDEEIH